MRYVAVQCERLHHAADVSRIPLILLNNPMNRRGFHDDFPSEYRRLDYWGQSPPLIEYRWQFMRGTLDKLGFALCALALVICVVVHVGSFVGIISLIWVVPP